MINVACRLYGVGAAQAYVYMLNCKKDTVLIKSLVTAVLYVPSDSSDLSISRSLTYLHFGSVIESLHSAFVLRLVYFYTVTALSNIEAIGIIDW